MPAVLVRTESLGAACTSQFLYPLDTLRLGFDPIHIWQQVRCAAGDTKMRTCSQTAGVNHLDGVTDGGDAPDIPNPDAHHSISMSHLVGGPNSPDFGSVDDQTH